MKIRHWLIRKLGGIVLSDLSPKIQYEILYKKSIEELDNDLIARMNYSWKCNYINKTKERERNIIEYYKDK